MNERVLAIRKYFNLTQEEFGVRIGGLSRNYVWMIEKGDRIPSDRTINDICREFNVNEEWLRNGTGEMFKPRSKNQVITDFLADIIKEDNTFRKDLIEALAELDEDDWEVLAKLAKRLAEKGSAADQENGEKK